MTEPLPDGPVERHLDDLFDRLAGTGGVGRRTLAEADDHLRATIAEGVAAGRGQLEAEQAAVERFGDNGPTAAEIKAVHYGPSVWLRPAFVGCWVAGGVGLVVVGFSGLLAELFGHLYGPAFVAGDAPGVTYTADRCADYFEYFPHAASCAAAAAEHHWGEVVTGRVAVGVVGLLALLVLWSVRATSRLGSAAWTPPRLAVTVPLAVAFVLAGVGFTGISLMQLGFHDTDMVGTNLASGLVSLVAALACWALTRRPSRSWSNGG
jgi:hypothetical protein